MGDEKRSIELSQTPFDRLLWFARRIDWRFLLPDPDLGSVAYIGPTQGRLVHSLRLFSASLTLLNPDELWGVRHPTPCDVAVLSDPTSATLRRIGEILRPGGWLYMEAYGLFSCRRGRRGFGRLRFVHDYKSLLQRLDMNEIEAYWHWPDFESCVTIVPLGDQTALSGFFAQKQNGVMSGLKATLGQWLLWSGLLEIVVPCVSIMAHCREPFDTRR